MDKQKYNSHEKPETGRKGQQIHTANRKRGVRYESDRLITKHVQENGVYYASDERSSSDCEDDELDGDGIDKKKRQRKQAESFRRAESEAAEIADETVPVPKKEPRRSRLNHSDETAGIADTGGFGRKAAAIVSVPVRHYLRHEAGEYNKDNVALESAEAGIESGRLLDSTVRRQNNHSAPGTQKFTETAEKNAAELEKQKKDQIRSQLKKKRHRAAVDQQRGTTSAASGSITDSIRRFLNRPAKAQKPEQGFFSEHKGIFIFLGIGALLFLMLAIALTGITSVFQGSGTSIVGTSYLSSDSAIYAVEKELCDLEDALDAQINSFEKKHPGYDEYVYQVDEIEHDPYQLISYLQAKYGEFECTSAIKAEIKRLFESQYILSVSEQTEKRTRTEPVTKTRSVYDESTGKWRTETYTVNEEVEYEYRICCCVLTNKGFDLTARGSMTADQSEWYSLLNMTLGNRDYLFGKDTIAGITPGAKYDIPPEALSDEKFAAIIREAEKYLGYPYVLGGKSPRTSFDCSGFVCWVLNHCDNNWNVGSKRAKDLCKMCIYVSPSEARPGDLIFFEKTYETSGASHVGIYVGNGMMLHCGNPIKYSSINTRYFKEHFLCFGRLPFYDN